MGDLILRAAIWQNEHWVDCSAILKDNRVARIIVTAIMVVLLSPYHSLHHEAYEKTESMALHDFSLVLLFAQSLRHFK